jgi:serine/threonine protein kinase
MSRTSAGLVHRDVKPGNILLYHDHCYLADFGLTKQASSISGLTGTGQLIGTVDYVAPEQVRGETLDGRTDEYALACVAYAGRGRRTGSDRHRDATRQRALALQGASYARVDRKREWQLRRSDRSCPRGD